jgi:hypothetical protein
MRQTHCNLYRTKQLSEALIHEHDTPVPCLAEPGPAGDRVPPPPCGQRGAQPIGYDIGDLCGPLGHAGLVEFIGDAVAKRG